MSKRTLIASHMDHAHHLMLVQKSAQTPALDQGSSTGLAMSCVIREIFSLLGCDHIPTILLVSVMATTILSSAILSAV